MTPRTLHSPLTALIRATPFAATALVCLGRVVLAAKLGLKAVPLSALAVGAVLALIAVRVALEAKPPKETLVFPALRLPIFVEVLLTAVGGLLLFSLAEIGHRYDSGFGPKETNATGLIVVGAMGAALLLWRPSVHLRAGEPLRRFPVGAWLPWSDSFPIAVELVWNELTTKRRPVVRLGYALQGHLGPHQVDVARVSPDSTVAERDALAEQWKHVFAGVKQGSREEQTAAVTRKEVKPWHMLAAMFGIPGLLLGLGLTAEVTNLAEAGLAAVALCIPGSLAFWFLSRLVSTRALLVLMVVTLAVPFAQAALHAQPASGVCEVVYDEDGASGLVHAGDVVCIDMLPLKQCNVEDVRRIANVAVRSAVVTANATCDSLAYEKCTPGPSRRKPCGPERKQTAP